MKTRNLTQSCARNDPINRRIHGFSFRDFEDEDGIQDVISPYSLDQFFISNTPQTRKHVKKAKKSKDSRIVVSRQFDFTRKSKGEFLFTKNIQIYRRIGDNMHFIHEFTWLLMQIKLLIVLIVCMLLYFKYISIILHNFMLWSKKYIIL